MSSLDIAPHPEVAPIIGRDRHRTRRRLRVPFRRAGSCTFWRLGFRQFSFHHIARVPRRTVPDTWTRPPVSWHAIFPLTFRHRVSHQTQGHPSNPSRLDRGYDETPRGAARICRIECIAYSHAYALASMFSRNLESGSRDDRWPDTVIRNQGTPSAGYALIHRIPVWGTPCAGYLLRAQCRQRGPWPVGDGRHRLQLYAAHVAVCCCPLPPAEKPVAAGTPGRMDASCPGGVDRLCTGQEPVCDTGCWFLAAEAL